MNEIIFLPTLLDKNKTPVALYLNSKFGVRILTCGRAVSSCSLNPGERLNLCVKCNLNNLKTKYSFNVPLDTLPKYSSNDRLILSTFKTLSEWRTAEYKGVNFGYALVSWFVSTTRNHSEHLSIESLRLLKTQYINAIKIFESSLRYFEKSNLDKVYIFNGRYWDSRAVLMAAESCGLDYNIVEVTGVNNDRYINYGPYLPHNTANKARLIEANWRNSDLTSSEKLRIAKSFFDSRRNGKQTNDKVYTSLQREGHFETPSRKYIAIFTSSEDELFSIGNDWIRVWANQVEGVAYLLQLSVLENYIFVIRMHPNSMLTTDEKDLITKLKHEYANRLIIIYPSSPVSTYEVLDGAVGTIVFGSTMGVESIYNGIPVVNYGSSFGGSLGCFKNILQTGTKEEYLALKFSPIEPKQIESTYKYGFFCLESGIEIEKWDKLKGTYNSIRL